MRYGVKDEGTDWSDDLLVIHKDRLDEDCETHARRVCFWGHHLAHAKAAASRKKAQLRMVAAEMADQVRSNPEAWNAGRGGFDAVKQIVEATAEYMAAEEEFIQATLEADLIETNYWALRERGEQIGNMVKLHGQMYWAKPDTAVNPAERASGERARVRAGEEAAAEVKPRRRGK